MNLIITDHWDNKVSVTPWVDRHGINFDSSGVFEKLHGLTFQGKVVGSIISLGACPIKDKIVTIPWEKIF